MSNNNFGIESIQTTINQLDNDFAGRRNDITYDSSKRLHIHRRNRPFVWSKEMQEKLLDSILNGYYIPPIICSSKFENGSERREVMEGGNRITTFRKILNNEVRTLTDDERRIVESYPITIAVMRNLNSKQQRIMFRRLNKNVKVSDGQLYAMSEDDSPLVKEAIALLNDDDYPLRNVIDNYFFKTKDADNDGKTNLANAITLISAAVNGVNFITKSYNIQEEKVECQTAINRDNVIRVLGPVFEIFSIVETQQPLADCRRKRGQWNVGYLLGVILYDILENPCEIRKVQEKWVKYITKLRQKVENVDEAIKLTGGAQNLNATRYKRISKKVDIFLNENRLASDTELRQYTHEEDSTDEIEEIEEDVEENNE